MSPDGRDPAGSPDRDDPRYFDSHCHLTDDRLAGDRAEVIERAREEGVREMVTVGTDPADAAAAAELAAATDGVWATAGLHPHEAEKWAPEVGDRVRDLLSRPEVVAVGETGYDLYYENSPREEQGASFRAHMEMAAETGLPLIVHTREADPETRDMVEAYRGSVRGVLHCYTGGLELLETAVDAGWWVSFSGILTFDGFDGEERVRAVPDDRLLVETDSPYLAPVPERGKRNEPAFVRHTTAALAEIRDEPPARTAVLTRRNARRFYGLGDAPDA